MNSLLVVVFACSGMAALTYELVWSRLLQYQFGSTVYVSSLVFATFLLGFSIGSFYFRKQADISPEPIRAIAYIQIGIGVSSIVLLGLIALLEASPQYIPDSLIVQIIYIGLLLLPPAILLGALWPYIHRAHVREHMIGLDVGRLYSSNAFGAGVGVALSGFFLIPTVGFTTTSLIASGMSLLLGILLLAQLNYPTYVHGKKN